MAKISRYGKVTSLNENQKVIGTDENGKTKNIGVDLFLEQGYETIELARLAAVDARNAANSANAATENVEEAIQNANNAKGWRTLFTFEKDGEQRLVKKLIGYIDGTGIAPTDNIGEYVLETGYTTDKSLATNFKGSPFVFTDFTTEQITELKKPAQDFVDEKLPLINTAISDANTATNNTVQATDNAVIATDNAIQATSDVVQAKNETVLATNSAITATSEADTATQNAITATNEANTATVNANDAANNANNAANNANTSATNANNSADLVTSAATNANDAATAANTAANFANSQRGWSPKFVFEEDGTQRLVKKLDSWIGGTGTAPTDNVGMYVIDGGYTTDKSLATNFKGEQNDNLIAEYIHSGNLEVVVESIDYSTNTLTSLNHGLINGNRVAFNITNDCNVLTQTPFSQMWTADSAGGGYFVANATQDTFQLTLSNGGAVMILNNRVGNDFTKWKIERVSPDNSIVFNNLNVKSLRCRILGGCHRTVRYILNNTGVYTGYRNTLVSVAMIIEDKGALYGSIEFDIDIVNSCDLINVNLKMIRLNNSSTNLDYFTDNLLIKPNRTSPITTIPSISLNFLKPFNGTLIQILKK